MSEMTNRRIGQLRWNLLGGLASIAAVAVVSGAIELLKDHVPVGAHFIEEEADDLVQTVRRVAAERGSTHIFVGTPDESRRREIFGGSLLSRMVRELPGVDIRVVANRADRDRLVE
jgi:K+-sensing histidine kinase KdpD